MKTQLMPLFVLGSEYALLKEERTPLGNELSAIWVPLPNESATNALERSSHQPPLPSRHTGDGAHSLTLTCPSASLTCMAPVAAASSNKGPKTLFSLSSWLTSHLRNSSP